jgi:DNA-binding MarR family transcriptional regulator
MSREVGELDRIPYIALVHRANRVFQSEMHRSAVAGGFTEIRASHNAVFSVLGVEGARISDMALGAGITKQSMGEVVRDMVELGLVELNPDPADRRAKVVTYTAYGRKAAQGGTDHLAAMEKRFEELFGEDYETARDVIDKITHLLIADQQG